jgi:sensor c-di-GMP phosphodiesterase-like protein
VSSKRFFIFFITIGLLVAGIFYGPSVQAQVYDCGTYSAGDFGEGECTDETTTPQTNDPRDNPVTDGNNQPDTQPDGNTPLTPDSIQDTDIAREDEQRTDNSFLLWLGFGLLAILSLILGIWLMLRRKRGDQE